MNRTPATILLQSQNAETVRVIFDQNGGHDIGYQILNENSILGQFFKSVIRYADVVGEYERLNAAEGFRHWPLSYSAASLAPLFRRFPPAAFASTGPKNFPV